VVSLLPPARLAGEELDGFLPRVPAVLKSSRIGITFEIGQFSFFALFPSADFSLSFSLKKRKVDCTPTRRPSRAPLLARAAPSPD